MMRKSSTYIIPRNEHLLPVQKTELFGDSRRAPSIDYEKKEEEAIIVKKDLPADHLIATYWG